MLALLLVPMIGAMGLATEASSWVYIQRSAQNAADAAVLAAASNGCDPTAACASSPQLSPTYIAEARAVAASYNFVHGTNNTTVAATRPTPCPANSPASAGPICYQVTITKLVPVSLVRAVGYSGSPGTPGYQSIVATAIASAPIPGQDCITTKVSFQTSGSPSFNAGGCYAYSDGTATCNGNGNLGFAGLGFAGGFVKSTDTKCSGTPVTVDANDPFASTLKSNPVSGCTTVGTGGTFTAPAALNLSGTCYKVIGSLAIPAGGTTVTTSGASGSVIEVSGGNLVLNGNLTAALGQGLTIVFTGNPVPTAQVATAPGFITGSGIIDFGAPTSGSWSGVALYQDPFMTGISSPTYGGSAPTFNITGMIYAPFANMMFKGAINHEGGPAASCKINCGLACIAFFVNQLTIKGTGAIFNNPTSQCFQAGLNGLQSSPNSVAVRQVLVQ